MIEETCVRERNKQRISNQMYYASILDNLTTVQKKLLDEYNALEDAQEPRILTVCDPVKSTKKRNNKNIR